MSAKRHFAKRKVVGLALVAVLLLAAIGLAAYLIVSKNASQDDADNKPKTTKQVIDESTELKYTKGRAEAANMSADAYDEADSNDDKFALAEQTGAIYESNEEYDKAIEWYLKADDIKPNQRGPLGGLARCYKAKGDKAKAIEYFQKVLQYVDFSGRHGSQNDKAYYEYELNELKKGQ